MEAGLRSNEIRSLTRASFVGLEGQRLAGKGRMGAYVRLKAAKAKNRRDATLPIRPALAAKPGAHLTRKAPNAPAFALPLKDEVVGMIRGDLRAARSEWIAAGGDDREERERSYFLRDVSADGGVFDFHALRVTFITNMARAGVPLSVAVKLARHSDPKLTIGIYTKAGALDLESALDALPDLDSAPALRAAAV
jgi:hypothetical protein